MKHFLLFGIALLCTLFCSCQENSPKQAQNRGNLQLGDHYLFCHMSGRGEWTAYAVSEDGVNFESVLDGDSVFSPCRLALLEGGTRDAYVCRRQDNTGFVMTTTDMKVEESRVWNNHGIDLLTSPDLVEWNGVTLDFRKGLEIFTDDGTPSVYQDWSHICRVWAPQAIWDDSKKAFMVYFSMLNQFEESYDRVYFCYADSSFTQLTRPKLLFDWGYATSDADIQFVPSDGLFHMLVKREGDRPGIVHSVSQSLTGPWKEPLDGESITFDGRTHTEGVSSFQLVGDSTWRICFVEHDGATKTYYMGHADAHMQHFKETELIRGLDSPMQGSFLRITQEEYDRLRSLKR